MKLRLAVLAVFLLVPPAYAAPGNIGVMAAVKNQVQGHVDGTSETLAVGKDIFQNEVIETGPDAMAQLLFLDQTSLSIGPKSQVKLDRFIFDSERGRGDVVIEASRGAFRFVTGAQDPKSYTLKTPVATIGVRGTIVDFFVQDGNLVAILDEGHAFLTMEDGKIVELSNPGDSLIIKADGTIVGPKPWDGTINTVVKVASFPLYGFHFASTPDDNDSKSLDDYSNLTDELATHHVTSIVSGEAGNAGGGGGVTGSGGGTSGGGFGGSGGHPNNGIGNGGGDGVPGHSGGGDSDR